MGTYGYISIIAMVCYGFMLLMFLAAKRNRDVCTARTKPYCDRCCLNDICEKNGVDSQE